MLVIVAGKEEFFDDKKQEFVESEGFLLRLEHSLVSLSKWESKYQRAFLHDGEKTTEETMDYVGFMILDDVNPLVVNQLTNENLTQINAYVESPQTATTFNSLFEEKPQRKEVITSELIYYWMVAHNIPFECQHWHLNRLLTLIRVCNVKNASPKKMNKAERARQMAEINARRRAELGTSG